MVCNPIVKVLLGVDRIQRMESNDALLLLELFVMDLFVSQCDCPGCNLHYSGFYDVEIYQLPAATVERTCTDSSLKEETILF